MNDIYQRLADVYKVAPIDRDLLGENGKLIAERVIMVPSIKPNHQLGATMLLAVLAFPDDARKRTKFLNYVNAKLIKLSFSRNSPERKDYRQFTSISNKKIEQFLGTGKKGAGYRLNIRMRAADTLWRKINSNPNPAHQDSLNKIAEKAAAFNSHSFPAFASDALNEPAESFIKRILWPSKPVMHIAMALYLQLYNLDMRDNSVITLVTQADKWLEETLFMAEMIRVEFGSWFPSSKSQYLKERNKNFTIELKQTIALLPIVDEAINEKTVINQLFF